MDIVIFEFKKCATDYEKPGLVGFNMAKTHEAIHINLFGLKENQGAPVTSSLWTIRNAIENETLKRMKGHRVWSFTYGSNTTKIKFSTLPGEREVPYKLDFENLWPVAMERAHEADHGRDVAYDLETYKNAYDGLEPRIVNDKNLTPPFPNRAPRVLFTVPCMDTQAPDGVLRYKPFETAAYEYVLADTAKVRDNVKLDSVTALAVKNFRPLTSILQFFNNNARQPLECGRCTYDAQGNLVFDNTPPVVPGFANYFDLPFFPVAVDKNLGPEKITEIKQVIGFRYDGAAEEPDMSPAFS